MKEAKTFIVKETQRNFLFRGHRCLAKKVKDKQEQQSGTAESIPGQ